MPEEEACEAAKVFKLGHWTEAEAVCGKPKGHSSDEMHVAVMAPLNDGHARVVFRWL